MRSDEFLLAHMIAGPFAVADLTQVILSDLYALVHKNHNRLLAYCN